MKRIRPLGLALMAVFALSAVVATAAQAATEGPFYKVSGTRLASGSTHEVKASAKKTFTLRNKTSKVKVVCTKLALASGATINGSSGANSATSKETIEYSGCKGGAKEENTTECEPEGGKITTNPVVNTLGYSTSSRGGPILVLFKPVSGTTFATIKFTGTCFAASTTVTGVAIGTASPENTEKTSGVISFVETQPTIYTESGGTLTSTKPSLTAFGTAATLEGESEQELGSSTLWGVFI